MIMHSIVLKHDVLGLLNYVIESSTLKVGITWQETEYKKLIADDGSTTEKCLISGRYLNHMAIHAKGNVNYILVIDRASRSILATLKLSKPICIEEEDLSNCILDVRLERLSYLNH